MYIIYEYPLSKSQFLQLNINFFSITLEFLEKMEKRRCIFKYDHVPDEIWFEILSRMPIKSLLVSRAVCKSWNTMAISLRNKITRLPLCGLVLFDLDSYLCLRMKKLLVTNYQMVDSPDKLTVLSGYDKGWLGNSSFDFSVLYNHKGFYSVSRGLLLLSLDDGTYLVHNPATKERFVVPKSPMAEIYGSEDSEGAIILLLGPPFKYASFIVVLLFCKNTGNHVEYFDSWTGKWFKHMQNPVDYLYSSDIQQSNWSFQNYVPLTINGRLMAFFLTDWDSLAVIKFATRDDPMVVHGYRLPPKLYGGSADARLGEWGGRLYLCQFVPRKIRVWKYNDCGSSTVADDVWVPLVRLKITQQLCKVPVGLRNLAELFETTMCQYVVTLGFHVARPIVFLYSQPIIYAYNFANDTLDKIVEINHREFPEFLDPIHLAIVYQFTPFYGPLQIPRMNS